jgi:hypothetical protein
MKRLIYILILIQLSGCAVYGTEFDCQAGKGAGCKSISQVNEMVNNGELVSDVSQITEEQKVSSLNFKPSIETSETKVKRLPERTARVWINSFIDDKGDYVGETYVHTVLEPGKWQENAK